MKKYTEEELEKIRASVKRSKSIKQKKVNKKISKSLKEMHKKRKKGLLPPKLDPLLFPNSLVINVPIKETKKKSTVKKEPVDIIEEEPENTILDVDDVFDDDINDLPNLLNINRMRSNIDTDKLSQPSFLNISDIYPDLAFIDNGKDVLDREEAVSKKINKGHPLRREILIIEYILRNPAAALNCKNRVVYSNIPLYLPIETIMSLEIILRYARSTGESIDIRNIFIDIGKAVNKLGYSTNMTVRSVIYKLLCKYHGKHTADTLSSMFQYKGELDIPKKIRSNTLYTKFLALIDVFLRVPALKYPLIVWLCTHFFKHVYINSDILFAIKHDKNTGKYTQLKSMIRGKDMICVGGWYSFLEKLLKSLASNDSLKSKGYGTYSKLIASNPERGSALFNILNDIRELIAYINKEYSKKREITDKTVIAQSIDRKNILKLARKSVSENIYVDEVVKLTSRAKDREAKALKRMAKSKFNENKNRYR